MAASRRDLVVGVIDARQVHAVMRLYRSKTDANNAHLSARIGQMGFCRSVSVHGEVGRTKK